MRNSFIEAIKTEQRRIQTVIDLSVLAHESHGSMRLQKQGHRVYAYERWQEKGKRERKIYLGTLDSDAVQNHFAIRFQKQRLDRLLFNQNLLQDVASKYRPYDFDSIVFDMPQAYRTAARNNSFDKRYAELQAWANADYPKNTFPFTDAENIAADGTRLRSKGECLFYNLLQQRGILFRNDCRISITDSDGRTKVFCPDFLIQCFDGTFIVIEHLGGMGEYGYAVDFGERSHWFFKEGFVLGRNYFVTSDDPYHGTDSQIIARVVDRVEEMFFGFEVSPCKGWRQRIDCNDPGIAAN